MLPELLHTKAFCFLSIPQTQLYAVGQSKALHVVDWYREQTRDQYSKYINRYGPGMVIYWFGFIDDLQGKTADLVLADAFPAPEDVTQLLCLHVPSDLLPSSSESRSIEQSAVCDVVDSELPSL